VAKVAGDPVVGRPRRKLVTVLSVASCALALIVAARWIDRMQRSVTLPNGMMLARSFDWTFAGRDDLLAPKGGPVVARDVEAVCFNDRYVWAQSRVAGHTGLYDAAVGARLDGLGYPEAMDVSGLGGGAGCGGYYLGMVGPGLLYDGNEAPFLPPCAWRNVGDETLEDRDWFDRPCIEDRR
jgi:hypothetical protein